jgi:nucleoside-diphosphate-sugar epimerase
MDILITGIHGFVGGNLVKILGITNTIYGLDIISLQKDGIEHTYLWDELESVPPVEMIIHLAGKAHDIKKKADAQVYFDINAGLTKKIFDWFLQSSAGKFIFFSSVKAVADTVENILTEDVKPSPKGPYGESKLVAENYIRGVSTDMTKQVYVLRPAMIHGPGNKGNLNLLYGVVRKGIPWPLGSFDNRRSFTSIDNLNYIINKLVEENIEPGVYNIADDETLSTNEIIKLMCNVMSRRCKIWHINRNVIKSIAALGSILHFILDREKLDKLTENYIVSNEKIKKTLDIDKLPVSAREGFIKTIRSFEMDDIQV